MKRTAVLLPALSLALAAVLAVSASAQSRAKSADALEEMLFDLFLVPLEGKAPPPFSLKTLDGREVSLAGLRGQVVLVYYWATW